ncbi:TIGR03032 family protein [Sphingomonas sp.]|uniref:TIGR03032 family protein n=1 Tax=Sphingomonas sp. TaxID=28214 RepID=UPI001B04DA03|nr:TIGR03032 family protein [Sphingomonas sp.]MBO9712875.1 TIGR03032 family protein [Sphingomonas sp.]
MNDTAINPRLSVSPGISRWLVAERLSVAFTSYQTGRLLLMGVGPDGRLSFNKQNYTRAMGLHYDRGVLHLAAVSQVWRLENGLMPGEYAHGLYDAMFVPRAAMQTGYLDAHDLAVDRTGRVVFVNTRFSCLATLDERFAFRPVWKPRCISALMPEDRCHLNGLAMADGAPRYATLVAPLDTAEAWREAPKDQGQLIDVTTDAVIAEGLWMPHSPRIHQGAVWLLDSGRGWLVRVDPASGAREDVVFCPGFSRGLALHGDHAVIALSQARHGDFGSLPLQAELEARGESAWCGLVVVSLPERRIIEHVRIEQGFTELYDVALLPGVRNPMSVGPSTDEMLRMVRFAPDFAPIDPSQA